MVPISKTDIECPDKLKSRLWAFRKLAEALENGIGNLDIDTGYDFWNSHMAELRLGHIFRCNMTMWAGPKTFTFDFNFKPEMGFDKFTEILDHGFFKLQGMVATWREQQEENE